MPVRRHGSDTGTQEKSRITGFRSRLFAPVHRRARLPGRAALRSGGRELSGFALYADDHPWPAILPSRSAACRCNRNRMPG
jgi:hypothetical protein